MGSFPVRFGQESEGVMRSNFGFVRREARARPGLTDSNC